MVLVTQTDEFYSNSHGITLPEYVSSEEDIRRCMHTSLSFVHHHYYSRHALSLLEKELAAVR